jgi:HAD superfamily hydrolase (TIGR01509 family)
MPTHAAAGLSPHRLLPRLPFKPAAWLFDLDGTLVDTEPLFEHSESSWLAGYGISLDEELMHQLFGQSARGFFEIIGRRFPESPLNELSLEERLEAKTRHYLSVAAGKVRTFPAMETLVRGLASRGLPLAIASSSDHEIIDFELETVALAPLFPHRVSAVDVARGKPEPDVFLEAARRLGVDAKDCVVFEDSLLGTRAAKAAGAFCLAFPAPGARLERFAFADFVLEGGPGALRPEDIAGFLELNGL